MKIAILTQYFYPETGAPQNRLLELAQILIKKNCETTVITALPNYPTGKIFSKYRKKFSAKEDLEGIKILRYWMYASNSAKSIPRIFSMLSFSFTCLFSVFYLRQFKPDFFFVESPPLTLGFSAYILSRLSKSKLIMNVSDIWPLSAKELGAINDGFLYRQLENLEKMLYRKSELCSGQSEEITKHITESGGSNVYLFRNGVDVNRFNNSTPDFQNSGQLKIVYAGLLGVAQGVYGIARNVNFKEINAELHIYGEGAERNSLEEYLEENPGRNIFLHKRIQREEIPAMLSKFQCVLIPLVKNIYGAVPSKIYEAMAAGLPILYSGSGEGANIVKQTKSGLVSDPKDYNVLKTNIDELRDSVELRKEMSHNGKEAARSKFNREIIVENFYKKLISIN